VTSGGDHCRRQLKRQRKDAAGLSGSAMKVLRSSIKDTGMLEYCNCALRKGQKKLDTSKKSVRKQGRVGKGVHIGKNGLRARRESVHGIDEVTLDKTS